MKKETILFLLLFMPVAAAQFDMANISNLTLILPLILTGIIILFFLIIYIKDHIKSFSFLLKVIPEFKHKKSKKEQKPVINFKKELDLVERRSVHLSPEDSLKQISGLIKDFFIQRYKVEGEFTYSDLKERIRDKNIGDFLDDLTYIKYSQEEINPKDISKLILEFKEIIKKEYIPLIIPKQSFLSKIKLPKITFFHKLKQEYIIDQVNFIKRIFKPSGKKILPSHKRHKQQTRIQPTKFKLSIITFFKAKFTKKLPKPPRKKQPKLNTVHLTVRKKHFNLNWSRINIINRIGCSLNHFKNNCTISFKQLNPLSKIAKKIQIINCQREQKKELNQFDTLIQKSKNILHKDIHKSENYYSRALLIYYSLPIKLQKKNLTKIIDIHNQIEFEIEQQENKYLNSLLKKTHNLKSSAVIMDNHQSFIQKLEVAIENINEHIIQKLSDKISRYNTKKILRNHTTEPIKLSKKLISSINKLEKKTTNNLINKVSEEFKSLFMHLKVKNNTIKINQDNLKDIIQTRSEIPKISPVAHVQEKILFDKFTEPEKGKPVKEEIFFEKSPKNPEHYKPLKNELNQMLDELTKEEKRIFEKLKKL